MSGPAYRRCEECGAAIYPLCVTCPACGSRRLAEAVSEGRGVVYSTSTVHRREGAHDVSPDRPRGGLSDDEHGRGRRAAGRAHEAGDRQRAGAQIALAHANGGALAAQATAVLGTLATL